MRAMRLVLALLIVLSTLRLAAEDWTRFRGPNGSGVSSSTGLLFNSNESFMRPAPLPPSGIRPSVAG